MKKILVIEDNKDILDNIAEILELSNYHAITALNGKLGVEEALKGKPDLILCDILMPELDGYGVLHMVQQNPDLEQTPFIFLSAKTEHNEVRKGMSLGADDYITKPFDPTDLLNAIEKRLKKSELVKKKISQGIEGVNEMISFVGGEQVLQEFVEGRHVDKYKKGQRIFSEGNHPLRLYYVMKGKIKVFRTNDRGKELILKISNEGEFFGYVALIENTVYKEFADALEDCEIIGIPKNEFDELMNSNREVSRKFIKLLAGDILKREDQLIHIAYNSLRRKVADALLFLKEKFKDRPGAFSIHISRENLAAVAGTATESLIRTLTDFKTEKLIDIRDADITILDEEKLQRLTN
ncbi:MAG TPA: response regulator [Flavisolibacter sp.]|nr:response regulator [Flavisolibacter sp.]